MLPIDCVCMIATQQQQQQHTHTHTHDLHVPAAYVAQVDVGRNRKWNVQNAVSKVQTVGRHWICLSILGPTAWTTEQRVWRRESRTEWDARVHGGEEHPRVCVSDDFDGRPWSRFLMAASSTTWRVCRRKFNFLFFKSSFYIFFSFLFRFFLVRLFWGSRKKRAFLNLLGLIMCTDIPIVTLLLYCRVTSLVTVMPSCDYV